MYRSFRNLSLVASLASLSTVTFAQQPIPATTQVVPGQVAPGQIQPGQAQLGQIQPGQIQPGQAPGQSRPGQAQAGRPGQAGAHGMQAQGVSLNAFIVHKLKRGNEAEVELGQMVAQRTKTESVKKFAEMMVKSHTEMIRKLGQMDHDVGSARGADGGTAGSSAPGSSQRPSNTNQDDRRSDKAYANPQRPDSARTNNTRNSESNTDGAGRDTQRTAGGSQAGSSAGSAPGSATPGQNANGQSPGRTQGQVSQVSQAGQGQVGQGQAHGQAGQMGGMHGRVPQMLVAITDQACDNELKLTKEMLMKHEGDNLEMAYIGQQIVAHTCMLAHLQALKNSGPQELQQLVSEGEQTTRQHLEEAEKIAKELSSDIAK